jgi:hypothetical protein
MRTPPPITRQAMGTKLSFLLLSVVVELALLWLTSFLRPGGKSSE